MDCLTFMYSKAKACFKNTYIDCQTASAIVKTFPWLSEILIVIKWFFLGGGLIIYLAFLLVTLSLVPIQRRDAGMSLYLWSRTTIKVLSRMA